MEKLCLAIVDIDYFKNINDSFGHNVGDKVLIEFSKILQSSFRVNDYIIRYGGEEFLILLSQDKSVDGVMKAIERFHKKINMNKFNVNNDDGITLTASIGVNLEPHRFRNLEEALIITDKMLYLAKTNGRNRIETYNEQKNKFLEFFNRFEDVKELLKPV